MCRSYLGICTVVVVIIIVTVSFMLTAFCHETFLGDATLLCVSFKPQAYSETKHIFSLGCIWLELLQQSIPINAHQA
jgi:hypothetical protein